MTSGCWEWTGSKSTNGYGKIWIAPRNKTAQAHRVAYEGMVGPVPEGMQLDHLCRNRACVRPDHLEPVTIKTNVLRGEGVTARQARQTHCKRGHPFNEENTYRSPKRPNERTCRACHRENMRAVDPEKKRAATRRYYWRQKAKAQSS